MLEAFDALIRELGPLGPVILGVAALLEYVFPPFPGDTVTLLAGASVARGNHSAVVVLLALTSFSTLGMTAMWWLGRLAGRRLDRSGEWRLGFVFSHEQLRHAQAQMRARGDFIILLNRFLPSLRALVFVAAGASGTSLSRVVALGSISAIAWNTLLLSVGMTIGARAEALEDWLHRYQRVAIGVGLVALAFWGVHRLLRRIWLKRP
jgi:membrane protein DedA with SNARE-associated domain